MGNQRLVARIWNERIEAIDQSQMPIHLAKQNRPRIGGDASPGKIRQYGSSADAGKCDRL